MYTQGTLDILRAQEEDLIFDHFDENDALEIGRLLIDTAKSEPKPIAMQAMINNFPVFRFFLPGTGRKNEFWIVKKYNTVYKTGHSSLMATVELELSRKPPELWQRDEEHYALCGGGFPIRVRGEGIIGAYCVSGLPHQDDHRILTSALAKYLNVAPRVVNISQW